MHVSENLMEKLRHKNLNVLVEFRLSIFGNTGVLPVHINYV